MCGKKECKRDAADCDVEKYLKVRVEKEGQKMTLDEVIAEELQEAEKQENLIDKTFATFGEDRCLFKDEENECKKDAERHRQLAGWLKDYKRLLERKPCLDDAREDFMHDVYNTLDFLPTNEEANRIIDVFDRVTSDLAQESTWIPCSKQMPDPQENGDKDFSDWLQITIKIGHPVPTDAYVTEGYYCFSEQKWYTRRFVVGKVTAWRPLPEVYKETEDESEE